MGRTEVDFTGEHWKMKLPQYAHFTRLDTLDQRLTPEFIKAHLGTRTRYFIPIWVNSSFTNFYDISILAEMLPL